MPLWLPRWREFFSEGSKMPDPYFVAKKKPAVNIICSMILLLFWNSMLRKLQEGVSISRLKAKGWVTLIFCLAPSSSCYFSLRYTKSWDLYTHDNAHMYSAIFLRILNTTLYFLPSISIDKHGKLTRPKSTSCLISPRLFWQKQMQLTWAM